MANNILTVTDGDYGYPLNKLAPLVQGQYGQVLPIEIHDLSGNVVNLTGYSVLSATKRAANGNVTAIVGTIALSGTPSVAPQLTWTIAEEDTGVAGKFDLVVSLSNGSAVYETHPVEMRVSPNPAANAVAAAGLVGVTPAQRALLATIAGLTGLIEMTAGSATGIAIQSFMRTFLASANVIAARLNLLPSYTGNTGKVLAVNGAETDVEWVAQGGGGAVDSVFGRTGTVVAASGDYAASEITDDSIVGQLNVKDALDVLQNTINGANATIDAHTEATTTVHGIADTSLLLDNSDLGVTVQGYDSDLTAIAALTPANDDVIQRKAGAWTNRTMAQLLSDLSTKLSAISALTWAANSIILLTGTTTAAVQALASHVVTFLQSSSQADARSAIGAGTGNGDVTSAANITDNYIVTGDGGAKGVQGNVGGVSIDDAGRINATDIMFGSDANARLYRFSSSRIETASNFGVGNVLYVGNNQTVLRNGSEMQLGNSFSSILTPATIASVVNNATNNAITPVLIAGHNTTGTPLSGLGVGLSFTLESSTTTDVTAGQIAAVWDTETHASRSSKVSVRATNSTGLVSGIEIDDDATAGNTRLLLYDVDNGTIERVSVGVPDSGGAGYKVLRIPN